MQQKLSGKERPLGSPLRASPGKLIQFVTTEKITLQETQARKKRVQCRKRDQILDSGSQKSALPNNSLREAYAETPRSDHKKMEPQVHPEYEKQYLLRCTTTRLPQFEHEPLKSISRPPPFFVTSRIVIFLKFLALFYLTNLCFCLLQVPHHSFL